MIKITKESKLPYICDFRVVVTFWTNYETDEKDYDVLFESYWVNGFMFPLNDKPMGDFYGKESFESEEFILDIIQQHINPIGGDCMEIIGKFHSKLIPDDHDAHTKDEISGLDWRFLNKEEIIEVFEHLITRGKVERLT